ncbi:PaaI family thioesterase [Paracoccus shandongensis]|uniref:PaaI family thioesterase n=1 Tax=Paracoccus shandongensis TaxID=2816048 RepID=UPI001A901591|nr:PaaI family thioesterase [Paracoccus shandongensis]
MDNQIKRDADDQPEFAIHIGARLVSATPSRVEFEMPVTQALANRNGVLHGGAIMGLADNAGGTGTFLNLPEGKSTTTLESKTNFLRPIRLGDVARAVSLPLHLGRTTQIWQTTITRGDGKVAAIVTQTQMVIDWKASQSR